VTVHFAVGMHTHLAHWPLVGKRPTYSSAYNFACDFGSELVSVELLKTSVALSPFLILQPQSSLEREKTGKEDKQVDMKNG